MADSKRDYYEVLGVSKSATDDELKKVWASGRIDVELRQGKKLLNWAGLFSRRVADPDFDPYEAEKKKKPQAEEAKATDSEKKGSPSKGRVSQSAVILEGVEHMPMPEGDLSKRHLR